MAIAERRNLPAEALPQEISGSVSLEEIETALKDPRVIDFAERARKHRAELERQGRLI